MHALQIRDGGRVNVEPIKVLNHTLTEAFLMQHNAKLYTTAALHMGKIGVVKERGWKRVAFPEVIGCHVLAHAGKPGNYACVSHTASFACGRPS